MEKAGVLGASRHGCKVCGKSFPSGRSLGGHMRSHLSLNSPSSTDTPSVVDTDVDADRASGGGGYGLRENPKKTRRVSDFGGEVFGHVRRHASGCRDHEDGGEDVGVAMKMEELETEAKKKEEDMLMPSEATAVLAVAAAPRRRRRSMRVAAPAPAAAPQPVLTGFEKEQEEVALCLLMLSHDTGSWRPSAIAAVKEEPLEDESFARNGYRDADSDDNSALLQHANAKISKRKRKRTSFDSAGEKRGLYICPGCGKAFLSYQALGGHRASHKRINISCSIANVAPDHPNLSVETNASVSTPPMSVSPDVDAPGIGHRGTGTVQKFECPICYKVFASGQALGGHKQSHLITDGELCAHDDGNAHANSIVEPQQSFVAAGFLDLNLPARGDED